MQFIQEVGRQLRLMFRLFLWFLLAVVLCWYMVSTRGYFATPQEVSLAVVSCLVMADLYLLP